MTVTLTLTGVTSIPVSPATEHRYTPASLGCAFLRYAVCPNESNCTVLTGNGGGGLIPTPVRDGVKRVTGVDEPSWMNSHCSRTRLSEGVQKKFTDICSSRTSTLVMGAVRVTGKRTKFCSQYGRESTPTDFTVGPIHYVSLVSHSYACCRWHNCVGQDLPHGIVLSWPMTVFSPEVS